MKSCPEAKATSLGGVSHSKKTVSGTPFFIRVISTVLPTTFTKVRGPFDG